MSHIKIHREHHLGHAAARKIAYQWAEQVETEFGMDCTYEEGPSVDEVTFKRSGVTGTLKVMHHAFELDAKLGFLLGAFRDKIEREIVKNLDTLLAKKPVAPRKKTDKKA